MEESRALYFWYHRWLVNPVTRRYSSKRAHALDRRPTPSTTMPRREFGRRVSCFFDPNLACWCAFVVQAVALNRRRFAVPLKRV